MTTTAHAHPNIALVKYWGKQEKPGNLPATPNLSITLDGLTTRTTIEEIGATPDPQQQTPVDEIRLNGEQVQDAKIEGFMRILRARYELPAYRISSENDFPTGAGLASSASGFAALITAINAEAGLNMDQEIMSEWARQGSASAARSLFAGFVALVPPQWRAQCIAPPGHWPLETVVAITSDEAKRVGSTDGMERSRKTSPYYNAWVRSSGEDFANATQAITERNFAALAQVAELSCLKMHGLMLSSFPTLAYWNAATVTCMESIRHLREDGVDVFFTIDAGPQIKAICLPDSADDVAQALNNTPGVLRTIRCGMGDGAQAIAP